MKSKPVPTDIPTRISQRKLKAIRLEEQSAPIVGPASGRYCMIPPAPTPSEAGELLSLEFQMMNLPALCEVIIDDIEAIAWVNEFDLGDVINIQEETGAFDDKEPKSGNEANTVAPRRYIF